MEAMNDILAKLQAEKTRLEGERDRIEREAQRVQEELHRVTVAVMALQGEIVPAPKPLKPAQPATGEGSKRGRQPGSQLTPETKAKMAAPQQARWARIKQAPKPPAR